MPAVYYSILRNKKIVGKPAETGISTRRRCNGCIYYILEIKKDKFNVFGL